PGGFVRIPFRPLAAMAASAFLIVAAVPAAAQDPQQEPPVAATAAVPPAQAPAAPPRGLSGTATLGVSLESGRTDLNGIQFALQGQRPYSDHGAFTSTASYTFAST